MAAHFKIPLDLPHAGTVAYRIASSLDFRVNWDDKDLQRLALLVGSLQKLLNPYRDEGENPPPAQAEQVKSQAAQILRDIVDEVERLKLGTDRLGQCVRNLFECLEMGEEGVTISLRAGENPNSPQRPR